MGRRRQIPWNDVITPTQLALQVLVDQSDGDLTIMELLNLLGESETVRFMKVFGGRTLTVPSLRRVRRSFLAAMGYLEIERTRERRGFDAACEQVSLKLGLRPAEVRRGYDEVSDLLGYMEGVLAEMRTRSADEDGTAERGESPV